MKAKNSWSYIYTYICMYKKSKKLKTTKAALIQATVFLFLKELLALVKGLK